MLHLSAPAASVVVEPLPGLKITFRPLASVGLVVARAAAGHAALAGGTDAEAGFAFTVAAAAWGAISWEGVAGELSDEPLPCTREAVEALLCDSLQVYDAVDTLYVLPALQKEAEKNGSSPSPNGASTGVGSTAQTASSAAPSARKSSTNRKRKTA